MSNKRPQTLLRPELHTAGCENFFYSPVQVNLHGDEDASAIINQASNDKYSLVVIDTLAMSIGEESENDGRDMGMFISNIMRPKAHFGYHIMILHHTGKDKAKLARARSKLYVASCIVGFAPDRTMGRQNRSRHHHNMGCWLYLFIVNSRANHPSAFWPTTHTHMMLDLYKNGQLILRY